MKVCRNEWKAFFLALVLFMGSAEMVKSQSMGPNYKTALGVKFYPGAISIKHFVSNQNAIEGLATFWHHGFRVTGLFEHHMPIGDVPGFKWYVGGGAHIGVWNDRWRERYNDRPDGASIGVDGVIGLDYKFTGAPINLSLDWQPSFNFIGYNYFEPGWGGFAVRYTF